MNSHFFSYRTDTHSLLIGHRIELWLQKSWHFGFLKCAVGCWLFELGFFGITILRGECADPNNWDSSDDMPEPPLPSSPKLPLTQMNYWWMENDFLDLKYGTQNSTYLQ
jgi:hypothetical protein